MNTHTPIYSIKDTAKDALKGKYFSVIIFLLFANALSMLVTDLSYGINMKLAEFTGETVIGTVLYYVILIAFSVISQVFQIGITLYFLKLACGYPYSPNDLFYGFAQNFKKSLGISALYTLFQLLLQVPLWISQTTLLESHAPLVACITLVMIVLYLLISLNLSQSIFLFLDYPELPLITLLKKSASIMRGHKKRLLLLEVSFLPVLLLGVLSFGIGLLWVLPYIHVAHAIFYIKLMKD